MLKSTVTPIRIAVTILLSFCILFILLKPAPFNIIRARVVDIASAPLIVFKNIGRMAKNAAPFASYRNEIIRLKKRIAFLESEAARLKEYYAENQRIKRLLDFRKNVPYKVIPAQVIARDPANWAHSLIINKGTHHTIRLGAAAFTPKGMIGRVVEVGNVSAKILLITDPNSKVGVMIRKNREGGLLVGRSDGNCKMIYIALDAAVAPGDTVITAGYAGDFPKGLRIGTVISVAKEPGRLYKYAIVRPSQNLSKVEELLCVR